MEFNTEQPPTLSEDYFMEIYANAHYNLFEALSPTDLAGFAKRLNQVDMYVLAMIAINSDGLVENNGITNVEFTSYTRKGMLQFSERPIYAALGRLELFTAIEQMPFKRTSLYRLKENGLFIHLLLSAVSSQYRIIIDQVKALNLK